MENKEALVKSFGENASSYRASKVFSNEDDLERMIKMLNPQRTELALDIATGAGHTAIKLSKYVKEVIAIDIVESMLNQAKLLLEEEDAKNINLMKMDACALKFQDGSFDMITCRFAPHHFYNIEIAIKEMYRVLKKGGRLYVLDCSVLNLEEAKKIMNNIEKLRDPSHIKSYSLEDWKTMLENQGFYVKHIETIERIYILPDWFERMKTPIEKRKEIFNILRNMPKQLRNLYCFDDTYITTYYVELLAIK